MGVAYHPSVRQVGDAVRDASSDLCDVCPDSRIIPDTDCYGRGTCVTCGSRFRFPHIMLLCGRPGMALGCYQRVGIYKACPQAMDHRVEQAPKDRSHRSQQLSDSVLQGWSMVPVARSQTETRIGDACLHHRATLHCVHGTARMYRLRTPGKRRL